MWGAGDASVLELYLPAPRALAVSFRAVPFRFPGAPVQEVSFELNGTPGPRVPLASEGGEYHAKLGQDAARAGWNRLALRYAYARAPSEVAASADTRRLAVAWERMRFDAVPAATTPTVDPARRLLVIPAGSCVSYALRLPAGAALRFSASGDPDTSLVVRVDADGREAEELARLDASPAERVVRLPDRVAGIVRLSLAAEGGAVSSTMRLANPILDLPVSEPTRATPPARGRPNVILYLVDTLRADALGCYGSARPTSPVADAFAKDAVRYRDAITEAPWTRAAVATLFTGLPPRSHGVNDRADALGARPSTMAELFQRAGYETAGFITNGNVAPVFGFARGFDRYELIPGTVVPGPDGAVPQLRPPPSSEDATRRVLAWLDGREPSRPFLLYLHTADPHGPYLPPPEYRARVGAPSGPAELGSLAMLQQLKARTLQVDAKLVHDLRALYDAEVAENDEQLGRLLDALKHRGLYDGALIVLLADHGEEFYEHRGWEHGHSLYSELEQVPLVVKLPRGEAAGTTVDRTVQLEDVLPTLLEVLGVESPAPLPGRTLLDPHQGADSRAAFAHLELDGRLGDAVVDGAWKLVITAEGSRLFDRRSDPGDQHDVAGDHPVTVAYLESLLARHRADAVPGAVTGPAAVPPAVEQNLKALGYAK